MMAQRDLMSIHIFLLKMLLRFHRLETYNTDILTALKCKLTCCNTYYVLFFVLICCNIGYVFGCVCDVSVVCVI